MSSVRDLACDPHDKANDVVIVIVDFHFARFRANCSPQSERITLRRYAVSRVPAPFNVIHRRYIVTMCVVQMRDSHGESHGEYLASQVSRRILAALTCSRLPVRLVSASSPAPPPSNASATLPCLFSPSDVLLCQESTLAVLILPEARGYHRFLISPRYVLI